jgi:UDPglucose 6-dehydrogenase
MESLWEAGVRVQAFDPVAMEEATRIYGAREDLSLAEDAMSAVEGADALAIVTEWTEFRSPDFHAIAGKLKHPVLFDGRNMFEPQVVTNAGLTYFSIGRRPSNAS